MKLKEHASSLSLALIVIGTVVALTLIQILYTPPEPNLALEQLRVDFSKIDTSGVDHSQFAVLQQKFNSAQEVTATCLTCHEGRHDEVVNSSHFNWDRISYVDGRGIKALGKKNALNNYCISVTGNEQACAKCHTGYGMTDQDLFDFENANNVDCLSCHAQTDEYKKGGGTGGLPAEGVDLSKVAQTVGKPTIDNCGNCHFYGGGGNNVKHGDLEEALFNATRDIDVHMAIDGINLGCVGCHTAENHQILGKLYSVSSSNVNRLTCESCHTPTPHLSDMLNKHTVKVACQTCHIPEYAKVNPTKMEWYWSEAGHLKDGEPFELDDEETGAHTYMSIKGAFKWETHVEPEYVWFNGKADHYFVGDKIDTSAGPVQVNSLLGSHDDSESKIIPVKVHRGDQIYDTQNLTLIQPKLYAEHPGDSAYWQDFDWDKAAAAGMQAVGLPYSHEYDFIKTEMYWPVNHMVSKAEASLQCADCHTRDDGRLAELTGFYLPGRDRNTFLDTLGGWMLILVTLGVVVHGAFRIISHLFIQDDLEMTHYKEFEE